MSHPRIIQGGMGAGISAWPLARAVSKFGQLGVVSGVSLDTMLAKQLQLGDPGGHLRRALERLPIPGVAQRILDRYYKPSGKSPTEPYILPPAFEVAPDPALRELTVAANFVEVFLAKDGHDGLIGINYLEKVQLPTLPAIYGAMLAGVDYVIMGAGIPRSIPGILDQFASGETAQQKIYVAGPAAEDVVLELDPSHLWQGKAPTLKRPRFLAVVSSSTLALTLARKSNGQVDGFVIEGPSAGGHNAPPRGNLQLNSLGEPIYGPRDEPDLQQIRAIGRPFWLAGGYGHPHKFAEALALGAAGVQVGTPFAFCAESGLAPELKRRVIEQVKAGAVEVLADPIASPTGFPFQVVQLKGTLSDEALYARRRRICDLSALREVYRTNEGKIGYRCPAEPVAEYLRKGGTVEQAKGRQCLCNALHANIGLQQIHRSGEIELPLITAGKDLAELGHFVKNDRSSYSAAEVIQYILRNGERSMDRDDERADCEPELTTVVGIRRN